MVHAHFRLFLSRAFETFGGARHLVFSPADLQPNERLPPKFDDSLIDFPVDREWTPDRGPRNKRSFSIMFAAETTANASLAPSSDALEDTDMVDPGAATANALSATPQSTTT